MTNKPSPVGASSASTTKRALEASVQRFAPVGGRVLMSTLFLLSGLSKLTAPAATLSLIASAGFPLPWLAFAGSALIEVGGSLLLIVGYQARLVAVVMAGFTLLTALAFHTHFADQNQLIHFFKNVAITGGLLQVTAFGAGAFSLDRRRG